VNGAWVRRSGRATSARVVLCILTFLFVSLSARGAAAGPSRPGPTYLVILVLDGGRPDYFNLAPMPNLRWLQRQGITYSNAFVGQQIANTPPSHATIGTGLFPRRHGVMGFVWTDPRTHLAIRPADTPEVQAGQLESVMAANHVPSIASAVKQQDPHARIVAVSGHKCYAADAMGTAAADYILCALIYHDRWVAQAVGHHQPPPGAVNNSHWDVPIPSPHSGFAPAVEQWQLTTENDWAVRYGLWAFERVHYPRVLMINLPETDVMGHFAGAATDTPRRLMRAFDADLGRILNAYRHAGILGRTTFVVTADHGMSVAQSRLPFSVLDRAIQLAGATKVYIEADTAAVIGIRELGKARAVARAAALLGGPAIDATYYKTLVRGEWFYQPAYLRPDLPLELRRAFLMLANTAAAATGPDVVVDYVPHVTTGDRPTNGYHWLAGHLGPQWDDQHIPLIIAGPQVRHDTFSSYPARLVDIAPTVERLLGLQSGSVDGIVLADAMQHPSRHLTQQQESERKLLDPLLQAIYVRTGSR
jgi:Type I phosphodiesterase / nucleotide pyrophosphatase